ncbi:MAG: hypothetical protein ACJARK_002740, partial [Marinobacter psychrophilus]
FRPFGSQPACVGRQHQMQSLLAQNPLPFV